MAYASKQTGTRRETGFLPRVHQYYYAALAYCKLGTFWLYRGPWPMPAPRIPPAPWPTAVPSEQRTTVDNTGQQRTTRLKVEG